MTDTFKISVNELEKLCAEAVASGGDWCDLFFEHTLTGELLLRDSTVCAGQYNVDRGCGIRVLCGEKTGYAYSESISMPSLLEAARAAGSIATGFKGNGLKHQISDASHRVNFYPCKADWDSVAYSELAPVLELIEQAVRSKEPVRTDKVSAVISWEKSEIMMFNSLGELTRDVRPMGSVNVSAIFRQNGEIIRNDTSRSFRMGPEMLAEPKRLAEELACNLTDSLDERFEARRPKGGRMPVVMAAGASGILLHEAMGHAFEADFNRKEQSVFSDKMGGRICRKGINIVDDGTLMSYRGSCNFDDEGVPGQKTYMVTDGILTSYLHDRISAAWYGVSPTGNGRRESFRFNPIPRMRSTYMENGTDGSCADLIAGVKKGIFVNEFSNGEVKIGEGDFTFYVKKGSLIENGRLTMPVKDINIIGNGPEALAGILAVGSDLKIDCGTWTCGKEQDVPVSCGIPSVLIDSLTVGGE